VPDQPYDFHATLIWQNLEWQLNWLSEPATSGVETGEPISTHVDCFHTHSELESIRLSLDIVSEEPIQDYLITLAVRAMDARPRIQPIQDSQELAVPRISQMQAPMKLRRRVCAPTCINMVVNYYQSLKHRQGCLDTSDPGCHTGVPSQEIIERSFHSASNLFGVWPANIRAASEFGCFGATETFHSLSQARDLIQQGIPVIASIAFGENGLNGAPLRCTAGHLVVIRGFKGSRVVVNDPAAACPEEVNRSYDAQEFADAWLRRRGVGYVLVPWQQL